MNDREAVTIDNATQQIEDYIPTIKYRCKLSNAKQIRAEMAKVYRQARRGVIDAPTAAKYTWCLAAIHTVVKTSDLEERMDLLEKAGT